MIRISTVLANAGLDMNTPIKRPMIVVTANPLSSPAPANTRGNIATNVVKKDPMIMKKAFLIFCFMVSIVTLPFLRISSEITI